MKTISSQIKNTDIYLIDQILKERFENSNSVLDVGCGKGRNLDYFIANNYQVFGIDANKENIDWIIKHKQIENNHFKTGLVESIPFQNSFDLIICNAVLHFAKNKTHFEDMLFSMWNKLNENGILFIRLASDIGIENLVNPIKNGIFKLPDGTTRYLVNEKMLMDYTSKLKGTFLEPIKTTNVQNLRCMTTWIIKK